ncbi:MAG: serine protease Do [Clostridiales bacterium]|nr:serine protease Do [Clostridiales bacterium]
MQSNKPLIIFLSVSIFLWGFGGGYILQAALTESETTVVASQTAEATSDTQSSQSTDLTVLSYSTSDTEMTIPEIVDQTADAVVEIRTETVVTGGRVQQYVSEGAGSGVIVTSDGYIATNNHVIEGASTIKVTLRDGTEYSAELIGRDEDSDIAVIKIDATNLPTVTFGDSDSLVVGELAVAIGNPLGELGGTVTEGIISALNRSITIDDTTMTLLQTSAAISPGNSGGGLFNAYGELIGIVNAKSAGTEAEGLGFAIPSNDARTVIAQLIQYGYIPGKVSLGFDAVDIEDSLTAMMYRVREAGVYVTDVTGDSTLQAGDRIVTFDGETVESLTQLETLAENYAVGDVVTVTVSRNGTLKDISLTLVQATY